MYPGRTRRVNLPYCWTKRILTLGAVAVLAAGAGSQAFGQSASKTKAQPSAKAVSGSAAVSKATIPAPADPPAGAKSKQAAQSANTKASAAAKANRSAVAKQCAQLLKMAKTLKVEVDKTTVNVLSVAVVRDAGHIQKFAHHMRDHLKSEAERH